MKEHSSTGSRRVRPLFSAIVLILGATLAPHRALASAPLAAHATKLHRGDVVTGVLPGSHPIHVEVALKLRNQDRLGRFVAARQHGAARVMSHDQLMADHAPTQEQAQRVAAYLRQSGFTHVTIAPNRLLVSADGTGSVVQMAFLTSIASVRTHDGRQAFANTDDVHVPDSLQDTVLSVIGLQNVYGPHLAELPNSVNAHYPPEFPAIYGATGEPAAAGVTVGIITQGALAQTIADLNRFTDNQSLPRIATQTVNTNGTSADTSGVLEWNLDSQDIVAMAGGHVGKIVFYNMPTLSNANITANINTVVAANAAKIINVSLGECETSAQMDGSAAAQDQSFQVAAAQGQTFSVSTGDSGADECGNGGTTPSWPAASQYVVAVAGTTLAVDSGSNEWTKETVWSGSGGSQSTFEPKPGWQTLWSGPRRGVADIAFDGDPASGAQVLVNGSYEQIGGTSLSAPLFAGLWARVIAVKGTDVGFAAPLLYSLPQADFHDVTLGSNGGFTATTGYDLASGRGSLVLDLAMKDFGSTIVHMSGDFNGDGASDLLWHNTSSGLNTIWLSGNSATVQNVATVSDPNWTIAGVGDFDGDHRSDILWRDVGDGRNVIWLSGNNTTPKTVESAALSWQVVGVDDFNGDGKADILWRNTASGGNAIWLGGDYATSQTLTAVASQAWQILGTGDFNGDGKADIFWRDTGDGRNTIWLSGNSATSLAVTAVDPTSGWDLRGIGDFNGDHKADLLWRNNVSGQDTIWLTANSSTVKTMTAVTELTWRIVGVGDFNTDHVSDVVWRNDGDGRNTIWLSANSAASQATTAVPSQTWMVAP